MGPRGGETGTQNEDALKYTVQPGGVENRIWETLINVEGSDGGEIDHHRGRGQGLCYSHEKNNTKSRSEAGRGDEFAHNEG